MLLLKKIGIVLVLAASAIFGTLGTRWIADRTRRLGALGGDLDPSAPAPLTPAAFSTDAIIGNLQAYLPTHPADGLAYANLGIEYLQKVRETGDPAYYAKAEGVLAKALNLDPQNFRALTGQGALALARHQFQDALAWGQRARALNPYNAGAYAIIGDAQIELGQYPDAFATFQHMVDLRPDLSSYARVSYARELNGDRAGAIAAMQQAGEAGGVAGEGVSWARVQLGNLYFNQGDTPQAEQTYQAALEAWPNNPYAQAGVANVWATAGNYTQAISMYSRLVNTFPLPQFVITLGDLYSVTGQTEAAAQQYDLVEAEDKLYTANGVDVDAELALFDADHGRHLSDALTRARAGYARRPSVTVADMLAWTLYKTGDYEGARQLMDQALRLGTHNALMYFHAGMIAYQLGQTETAATYLDKALTLNPHFSLLYAGNAKSLLSALRAAGLPAPNSPVSPFIGIDRP